MYAGGISGSILATGTTNLLNDLTTWLITVSSVVGVVLIVYFLIRKSAADEMDGKMWQKRIITTIVCVVAAVITSAIVKVILGYYGG